MLPSPHAAATRSRSICILNMLLGFAQAAAQQLGPAEAGRRACQSILDNNDMYFSVPYCVLGLFVLLILFHVGSYLALARLRLKTRA